VLAKHLARADVIITTAQIPGRPAPELIDQAMVESLKPGSVVVDLAAESGGNCAGTVAGETVEYNGVKIIGPKNLPGTMPGEASTLYSRNVKGLLDLLVDDEGGLKVDMEDEVIVGAAVTHGGQKVGAVA
jgi:NAD(P) transhydrogenase subunit alpha